MVELRPEEYATIEEAIGWVPVSTYLRILALRAIDAIFRDERLACAREH